MDIITVNTISTRGATVDHRTGRATVGRSTEGYRRARRAPSRPNYAARRIGALSGAILSVLVVIQAFTVAGSFFGASPVLAGGAVDAPGLAIGSTGTHVARSGESLWTIAEQHRGSIDRSAYLDSLIELNGGTAIVAGQAVLLP